MTTDPTSPRPEDVAAKVRPIVAAIYRDHGHDDARTRIPDLLAALQKAVDRARADRLEGGSDEGRPARYDHEARVWRDAETGEVVPSEPDAAWIEGGRDV